MRGLGGFILILLVLVLGLIWAVLYGPLRNSPLLNPQRNTASQPASTPVQPVPEPPAPKVRRAAVQESGAAAAPVEPAAAIVERPAAPPAPPPKLPTPVDVPLGMRGSEISAAFGAPAARTVGVDGGGQVETWIYRISRPDTTTIIQLRNGRVTSAVTMAY